MTVMQKMPEMFEGLQRDEDTGDYRVMSGYAYQALRYRINETYLDEDDNLWISAAAIERIQAEEQEGHAESK